MRAYWTIWRASQSYCDLLGCQRFERSASARAAARDCIEPRGKSAGEIPVAACASRIQLRLLGLSFIFASLTVWSCRAYTRRKPCWKFAIASVAAHLLFGHPREHVV